MNNMNKIIVLFFIVVTSVTSVYSSRYMYYTPLPCEPEPMFYGCKHLYSNHYMQSGERYLLLRNASNITKN